MYRVTAVEIKQKGEGTRVRFTRSPMLHSYQGGREYRHLTSASCWRLDRALWRLAANDGIDCVIPYTWPNRMTIELEIKRDRKALR